jgi:hypothetical protein
LYHHNQIVGKEVIIDSGTHFAGASGPKSLWKKNRSPTNLDPIVLHCRVKKKKTSIRSFRKLQEARESTPCTSIGSIHSRGSAGSPKPQSKDSRQVPTKASKETCKTCTESALQSPRFIALYINFWIMPPKQQDHIAVQMTLKAFLTMRSSAARRRDSKICASLSSHGSWSAGTTIGRAETLPHFLGFTIEVYRYTPQKSKTCILWMRNEWGQTTGFFLSSFLRRFSQTFCIVGEARSSRIGSLRPKLATVDILSHTNCRGKF